MNISTEPWIPIVWQNGQPGLLSLTGVFARGHEVKDLAVRPHERIAVMRLLICIAQAALDGPGDHDDWKTCAPPSLIPSALDYLKNWHPAFELFGKGQRFLQIRDLKKPADRSSGEEDQGGSISKLDVALATGNNSTLFDNAGGSDRTFAPTQLTLMLLTFQCFSPGGTIGVALWRGSPTLGWSRYPKITPGQSNHAPCISGGMLHALLRGDDLLSTVHRNLITKRQSEQFFGEDRWGKPVWECPPTGLTDVSLVRNATRTYLGRLVPLSRAIRLAEDGRSLVLANGLEYAAYPEWREPTATIVTRVVKDQPTRVVLRASIDKAAWRELHALTVRATSYNTNGGPAAQQNVSDCEVFDLWVGGLVANKGKLVDMTESVFHVPGAMLHEPSQVAYEKGVKYAEDVAFRLGRAVTTYHFELGDNLDRGELRTRRQQIQSKATAQYWTDVEQAVPELLNVAATPELLGLNLEWHKTEWGRFAWRAARAAYESACPHATSRQMRAYSLGLRTLFAALSESQEAEPKEEMES